METAIRRRAGSRFGVGIGRDFSLRRSEVSARLVVQKPSIFGKCCRLREERRPTDLEQPDFAISRVSVCNRTKVGRKRSVEQKSRIPCEHSMLHPWDHTRAGILNQRKGRSPIVTRLAYLEQTQQKGKREHG
jgi:hypothetical protein